MKHLILTICAFMMLSVLCPDAMAKKKKATSKKKPAAKAPAYKGPKIPNKKDHEVTLKGVFHYGLTGDLLFQPDKTEKLEGRKLWGIHIDKDKLNKCKNRPEGNPKDWNKKAMKINARVALEYKDGGLMKFDKVLEIKSLELIGGEEKAE